MTDLVDTYAEQALDRWWETPLDQRRRWGNCPHAPTRCPCIVCADGRVVLGAPALKPLFARRRVEARP